MESKQHVGECTQEVIDLLKKNIRAIDSYECYASSHKTGAESLQSGLDNSVFIKAMFVDDYPVCAYGVTPIKDLPDYGVVWMLGTNDIPKARKLLTVEAPKLVDEMLEVRPTLLNYVSIKNEVSIKWLKMLGFEMEDPEPYGEEQELFHFFYKHKMEVDNV